MQAVPPDPTHLDVKVKTNRRVKFRAMRVLVSTGKPGLYLKFEISAGYLLARDMIILRNIF